MNIYNKQLSCFLRCPEISGNGATRFAKPDWEDGHLDARYSGKYKFMYMHFNLN